MFVVKCEITGLFRHEFIISFNYVVFSAEFVVFQTHNKVKSIKNLFIRLKSSYRTQ